MSYQENTDRLIWTDYYDDFEDWKESTDEEYLSLSEDKLREIFYEANADNLDDERCNLDIQLSAPILVIGDLGLWNGRRTGYKEISSGNIRDCLYSDTDYTTWYVDKNGEFRCDAIHHDGTNHYRYRAYRDGVTDEQIEDLKEKIYFGAVTEKDIEKVTRRLGDDIGEVYGWTFPKKDYEKRGICKMSIAVNVNEETFEDVTVFGRPMIFTCLRCDRSTLPKGMYLYEVRHDDDWRGEPCEIAEHILVNHWGTLISNRPIRLEQPNKDWKPYRLIDAETDWNYEGTETSLKEYMEKHPPVKEKSYER